MVLFQQCRSHLRWGGGDDSSDPKWPRFLLCFVSVFFNLLHLFSFYREKHVEAATLICVFWAKIRYFAFELATIEEGIPRLWAATAVLKTKGLQRNRRR